MTQVLLTECIDAGYQGRTVLHGVSLDVAADERVVLIGPNGCGKTTLLKVLAGTLQPASGRVVFKGEDISHTAGHQRICKGLGYLMQSRNIFPSLTTDENLHLSFWHGNGEYAVRRDWVLTVFPMIKEMLTQRAGLLSGGERQALAIAMVLMRPVDLLLLDEPTAGLSPKAAGMILEAVQTAQKEAQFTSIMVEHNLRQVRPWVTRVLGMKEGSIEVDGDSSLLDNPEQLQRIYFG
jgi:ABC-type branched-subunit amino acid transport system ATPase component